MSECGAHSLAQFVRLDQDERVRPAHVGEVGDGVPGEDPCGSDVLPPAVLVVPVHLPLDGVQALKLLADEAYLRLWVEPLGVRVHRHEGDREEVPGADLELAGPVLLAKDVMQRVGHVDDLLVRLVPDFPDADGLEGGVRLGRLDRPAATRGALVLLVPGRLRGFLKAVQLLR